MAGDVSSFPRRPSSTRPGFAVLFGILVVGAIGLELTGSVFSRSGFSLAPTACVAVLGIACFPPWRAGRPARSRGVVRTTDLDPIEHYLMQAAGVEGVGGGGDILDGRVVYPEFLYPALKARILTFPSGESFLAARFESAADALEAAQGYKAFFRMEASGNGEQAAHRWVWKGPRQGARDFAWMRRDGDRLLVWTARDLRRLDQCARVRFTQVPSMAD